jgi:glycosidase
MQEKLTKPFFSLTLEPIIHLIKPEEIMTRYILLGFLLIQFLVACQSTKMETIEDLIPLVSIQSGATDTLVVRDLFYLDSYELTFKMHPFIEIKFLPEKEKLVLKPDADFEGLTFIQFQYLGRDYDIPVRIFQLQKRTFLYQTKTPPKSLNLFGSFNSWNRNNLPMTDSDGDGIYETHLFLEPGRYEYRFKLNDTEITDPLNPHLVPNPFGEFNSLLIVPQKHKDHAFLHIIEKKEDSDHWCFNFLYERDNQPENLTHNAIFALLNNRRIPEKRIQIQNNKLILNQPKTELKDKDIIRISVSQKGLPTLFQTIRFVNGVPAGTDKNAFTWNDAVMYSIIVDRFLDGDPENTRPVEHPELDTKANFHGGDLQGILDKLEDGYFEKLGVNVLWLSPIIQNTYGAFQEYPPPHRYFTGYHGYWPIHHEKVDDRFGDLNLFKELVRTAHSKGIRIILDFVANHVHQEHPFYQKHPEWFGELELADGRKNIRFWDEYRLTTWFDTFLPSFDFLGSDKALEVMTDNAVWWLKKTGIDGFRQDAVKHIPNSFWRILRRKIKASVEAPQNRRIYQIGETFGSYDLISSYVNNGQLDAQFLFQIYDTGIYVFLTPEASFNILDTEMKKAFSVYGMNHLMGNMMDSHDKVRYLSYADRDLSLGSPDAIEIGWNIPPKVDNPDSYEKAKLYLTFTLTIPGIPVIYYGDEIGITGAADPDNRRPMRFGDELSALEKDMHEDVSRIIAIRRNHSALRYGDFQSLKAEGSIYAYIRCDVNERILVILNKDTKSRKCNLHLPPIYGITRAANLITGETNPLQNNTFRENIPGITGWIFLLE